MRKDATWLVGEAGLHKQRTRRYYSVFVRSNLSLYLLYSFLYFLDSYSSFFLYYTKLATFQHASFSQCWPPVYSMLETLCGYLEVSPSYFTHVLHLLSNLLLRYAHVSFSSHLATFFISLWQLWININNIFVEVALFWRHNSWCTLYSVHFANELLLIHRIWALIMLLTTALCVLRLNLEC